MTESKDITEYNVLRMNMPMNAISVKKIGAGITSDMTSFGRVAYPPITQGSVRSDSVMREALLNAMGPQGEVTVIGHGWMDAEKFVWRGTVTEFLQTWKGD